LALPLLYATALRKITIHLMLDPINPRFLRIYRVLKPATKEGEILPPKPVLHNQAVLNCRDLASELITESTWGTNGLPSQIKTRPTRHHHITERHKLVFSSVTPKTHGSSLIGGSAKLVT
jgi:hypothetical protein